MSPRIPDPDVPKAEYAVLKKVNDRLAFGPYPTWHQALMALKFDNSHPNRYYIAVRWLVPSPWAAVPDGGVDREETD